MKNWRFHHRDIVSGQDQWVKKDSECDVKFILHSNHVYEILELWVRNEEIEWLIGRRSAKGFPKSFNYIQVTPDEIREIVGDSELQEWINGSNKIPRD